MTLSHTQLNSTTALTPAEIEREKTRQQRAEDIIYPFNHSLMCLGLTDTVGLGLAANAWNAMTGRNWKPDHDHNDGYGAFNWIWDRIRGKHKNADYVAEIHANEKARIDDAHAHGHDHGHEGHGEAHGHAHDHSEHAPKLTPDMSGGKAAKKFWHTTTKWLLAEAIGDLGAVPVTVFMQRKFPGFMNHLRHGIEWGMGRMFRYTTGQSAKHWGEKHGYAPDSQEVKDRQHELYEYELSHMPQMAVWTVASVALNYGAMRVIERNYAHPTSLRKFAEVKGAGALMTAGLVLGARAFTPGGAHRWDQFMGKHVILPVGRLWGIRKEDVERFQRRNDMNRDVAHPVHGAKAGEAHPENIAQEQAPVVAMSSPQSTIETPVTSIGRAEENDTALAQGA
jgi:hypothetical protein